MGVGATDCGGRGGSRLQESWWHSSLSLSNFLNLFQAQFPYLLSGESHSAHSVASLG